MGEHRIPRDKKMKRPERHGARVEIGTIYCANCFDKRGDLRRQSTRTFRRVGNLYYCTTCFAAGKLGMSQDFFSEAHP